MSILIVNACNYDPEGVVATCFIPDNFRDDAQVVSASAWDAHHNDCIAAKNARLL